ncbi:MAG TPA: hypothetical protein VN843_18710 [Anaerolineales bacterium]|nr:hypothetical protein [Anaerolineales bacterium]
MIGQRVITMFVRSDGSQWLFMSGLALGLAGNLVINALSPDPRPDNWLRLLIGGSCLVTASAFFSIQGWILQRLEYLARAQAASSDVKHRLVSASLARLLLIPIVGFAFTGVGILCIVTRYYLIPTR